MRWSGYLQEVQKKRVQGMYEGISGDRVKLEVEPAKKKKLRREKDDENACTVSGEECLLGRRWRRVRGG